MSEYQNFRRCKDCGALFLNTIRREECATCKSLNTVEQNEGSANNEQKTNRDY